MTLSRSSAHKLPLKPSSSRAKHPAYAETITQELAERSRPAPPTLVRPGSGKSLVRPEYQEFARKLREAMAERRMSASDVARAIWGSVPDPRGYSVAKNRDRIGAYLAGTGYPSKETLPKLCEVLGLSMDELPEASRSTAAREPNTATDVSFNLLTDHPGICSLYIRTTMSIETGLKIVGLVQLEREGKGGEASSALQYTVEQMIDSLVQKRMDQVREERETITTPEAKARLPDTVN